jgi:hypothetical protein
MYSYVEENTTDGNRLSCVGRMVDIVTTVVRELPDDNQ